MTLTSDSTSVNLGFLICGERIKIIPSHKVVVRMMQDHAGACSVKWYERAVKSKGSRSESGFGSQLFQLPLHVTLDMIPNYSLP